jgi:hypothetical protein
MELLKGDFVTQRSICFHLQEIKFAFNLSKERSTSGLFVFDMIDIIINLIILNIYFVFVDR